jgi:MSHA pilin protein MshC
MITFSPPHTLQKESGFTLVELVVIIIILGIISAFALPRFFNLNQYQQRAAYDEVASALRYAQKLAVGSGCAVQVDFTVNNAYALQQHRDDCTNGPFTTIAGHPVNSGVISGVNLNSAPETFIFDPMGRSTPAAAITVGGRIIRVVAETGTVDAQ